MTHTYSQPGTYIVNVTISNACHSITLQDTVVVTTVGINDATSNTLPVVYPNPANDVIQVAGEDGSTYQLIDGLGSVVETGVLRNGSIAVNILAEGVYFLRIGEQESRVYSVIIRR
jgi:PKD repeat protein